MKNILYLIIFAITMVSCEKEKIVEVEKEYKWKSHADFRYNEIVQMNSYATNDLLFFIGYDSFSSLVPDSISHPDLPFGGSTAHYNIWNELPGDRKMPICDDYFFVYNKATDWIGFYPTLNPVLSRSMIAFDIKSVDSSFVSFEFQHFMSGTCVAINNKKQALIPYQSHDDLGLRLKLMLLDIKVDKDYYVYLDTLKTTTIRILDEYQSNLIQLQSVGDYFFLTTDSKVYRVDNLGNIDNVLETRLNRIIESSGTLYGFGRGNIYISSDNGLTWNTGYTVQYEYSLLNYTKIDDKIIAYRYGQLWEIIINETGVEAKELDNDGLDGVSITSVSKFDGKVYLSTLSGVYYKLADDFFDYKIEE